MTVQKQHPVRKNGRARILKENVRVESIPILVGVSEVGAVPERQPTARLVRKEDGAERIEVVCSCGQKIVIECEFV